MPETVIWDVFVRFGLAALLGVLIGLERGMSADEEIHVGLRDFILVALFGALSATIAERYEAPWIVLGAFAAVAFLLLFAYRLEGKRRGESAGITTELAAMLTFFLGVMASFGSFTLAIALAIAVVVVLSQKEAIRAFPRRVHAFEFDAVLKLLVITFVVLPILPKEPLTDILTMPLGLVDQVSADGETLGIQVHSGRRLELDSSIHVYGPYGGDLGTATVERTTVGRAWLRSDSGGFQGVEVAADLRTDLGIPVVQVALSAINPHRIWLLVVLVSAISFVGYLLVKILRSNAGIGLTGLVGGLASSTLTTVSFAGRSKEAEQWSRSFAVAIVLASSVMFPRLCLQIAIVNMELLRRTMVPLLVIGTVGLVTAILLLSRSHRDAVTEPLKLRNPFSLKAALSFAAVFTLVLVFTRLALSYLGNQWLPLVSILSGFTDADAIAFSISDAEQAGLISLDWAGFNVVLGALANTFTKVAIVFALGTRKLLREVLIAFLIMGGVGILTLLVFYGPDVLGG